LQHHDKKTKIAVTPKVSILVPVYNVSPFIETCARSLFNQTFCDIEFIFVDDASPDDSMDKLNRIIAEYPNKKEQIQLIHNQTNEGPASSRHKALKIACGQYISFIDSDDYIDVDMIETLYNKAITEDADIVVSDIILEYPNYQTVVKENLSDNPSNYFVDMLENEVISSFSCNKLFRREFIDQPQFKAPHSLFYFEDRYIMTRLFFFAKKIVKVDHAFYHYVQYNNQAITKKKGPKHFENIIQFWQLTDEFLKEKNLYASLAHIIDIQKVKSKARLLLDTPFPHLRKKYASLFYAEETRCLHHFKRGEKLMLMLVRYRLFLLAHWLYKFSVYKNKLYDK
jgi:glycosyltransferase involved in cell wall biosynthesis